MYPHHGPSGRDSTSTSAATTTCGVWSERARGIVIALQSRDPCFFARSDVQPPRPHSPSLHYSGTPRHEASHGSSLPSRKREDPNDMQKPCELFRCAFRSKRTDDPPRRNAREMLTFCAAERTYSRCPAARMNHRLQQM